MPCSRRCGSICVVRLAIPAKSVESWLIARLREMGDGRSNERKGPRRNLVLFGVTLGTFTYPESAGNKPLLIFGAGEFGRIAEMYFALDSPYSVSGYVVDDGFLPADRRFGEQEVIPKTELFRRFPNDSVDIFVAISGEGLSERRLAIMAEMTERGYTLATYASSRAFVSPDVSLGRNSFIFEMNCIQSKVTIGEGVVMWSGNHVGHLSRIGRGCFITSHVVIAGECRVAERCYLGVNSSIRDRISLGPMTVVGANSYVSRDTNGSEVVFGSPAKTIPGLDPLGIVK